MGIVLENLSITNHLNSLNFFDFDNFSVDGAEFEEKAGSAFMEIIAGQPLVGSIAGSSLLVRSPSILSITFILDASQGKVAAKTKAESIIDALFDLKLDENGTLTDRSGMMNIDFGANGSVPYIASIRSEAPFVRTTVNASFVTTEKKPRS